VAGHESNPNDPRLPALEGADGAARLARLLARGQGSRLEVALSEWLPRKQLGRETVAQTTLPRVVRSRRDLPSTGAVVACFVQALEHRQARRGVFGSSIRVRVGRAHDDAAAAGDIQDAAA
jgi:hypothetical protein